MTALLRLAQAAARRRYQYWPERQILEEIIGDAIRLAIREVATTARHYVRDDVPEGAMLPVEFEIRAKIADAIMALIDEETPRP